MNIELDTSEHDALIEKARAIARAAYAPYSKFRVGAAVLGEKGIYVGTNVENASYGLCLCAERSALSAAVAARDLSVRAIAVACIDADPSSPLNHFMPCGACRQWISELAPDAVILIAGFSRSFSIEDLLPEGFRLG
jgi:cytidine deaminase